jgi:hypothetical protein
VVVNEVVSMEVEIEPVETVSDLERAPIEVPELDEETVDEVAPISINAEPTFRPLHIDSPVAALQDVPDEPVVDVVPDPVVEAEVPPKSKLPVKKGRKKQEAEETQALLF